MKNLRKFLGMLHVVKMKRTKQFSLLGSEIYHYLSLFLHGKIYPKLVKYNLPTLKTLFWE